MSDGQTKTFQMRVNEEFMRSIDRWRAQQPDVPPRAEAVRRMIAIAIEATKRPPDPAKVMYPDD